LVKKGLVIENMEMNQLEFAQTLQQLKDTARLQENMLTSEQISEAFESFSLTEEQMGLIHEYLNKNHIGIDTPAEQNANLSSEDTNYLTHYGETMWDAVDGATARDATDATIHQGYLEMSNTSVVKEMVNMISIQRQYEANQKLITTYDESLDKSVNQVGKV